jgi:hypothetical protein
MDGFLEKNQLLRAVLDAMPLPVFVIDRDLRVVDRNEAGAKFLGDAAAGLRHRLPGDILHCVVALSSPGGCGTGAACADCVLRGAVAASLALDAPVRRHGTLERKSESGPKKLHLFVTAAGIPGADPALRLLILEDFTEFLELRGLVPICAGCKKIRNDKNYWEQVEHFLARNLEMSFTHGMCPECLEQYYPIGSPGRTAPDPPLRADRTSGWPAAAAGVLAASRCLSRPAPTVPPVRA